MDEESHQVPVDTRPLALQSGGTRRAETNLAPKNRWNEPNVLRDSIVAGREERLPSLSFPALKYRAKLIPPLTRRVAVPG
jgi:hypothetical protein